MTNKTSIGMDLRDINFGRLTVMERLPNNRHNEVMWECHCVCGGISHTPTKSLMSGEATSCGCYNKERVSQTHRTHGMSKHRLYRIWKNMRSRCENPLDIGFSNYGQKGIGVCDEWRRDVGSFVDWAIENGYREELTIDRYPDPSGNYEPANCRWATMAEQNQNQSTTRIRPDQVIDIRNDPRSESDIAESYGVNQSTISRIKARKTWKNIE